MRGNDGKLGRGKSLLGDSGNFWTGYDEDNEKWLTWEGGCPPDEGRAEKLERSEGKGCCLIVFEDGGEYWLAWAWGSSCSSWSCSILVWKGGICAWCARGLDARPWFDAFSSVLNEALKWDPKIGRAMWEEGRRHWSIEAWGKEEKDGFELEPRCLLDGCWWLIFSGRRKLWVWTGPGSFSLFLELFWRCFGTDTGSCRLKEKGSDLSWSGSFFGIRRKDGTGMLELPSIANERREWEDDGGQEETTSSDVKYKRPRDLYMRRSVL